MASYSFAVTPAAQKLSVDLLIVMPIYNEEAMIEKVIEDWLSALQKAGVSGAILALNDGSKDGTWAKLQELEKRHPGNLLIIDKLNSGHGLTCRLGYDIAVASSATWVLQIDSDGQCIPDYFSEFWKQRENADCIFGLRKTRGDGVARVITSKICTNGASLLTGTSLADANVPYRLIRTSVLGKALPFVPRHVNVQNVALTVTLKRLPGLRWQFVPIHFPDRQGGVNSINLRAVAKLGFEMLVQVAQLRKPQ
jgi:dolichol-phosphate mannosyltransferase